MNKNFNFHELKSKCLWDEKDYPIVVRVKFLNTTMSFVHWYGDYFRAFTQDVGTTLYTIADLKNIDTMSESPNDYMALDLPNMPTKSVLGFADLEWMLLYKKPTLYWDVLDSVYRLKTENHLYTVRFDTVTKLIRSGVLKRCITRSGWMHEDYELVDASDMFGKGVK